jgi:hypothetical protein
MNSFEWKETQAKERPLDTQPIHEVDDWENIHRTIFLITRRRMNANRDEMTTR